jgi:hypothetical protein
VYLLVFLRGVMDGVDDRSSSLKDGSAGLANAKAMEVTK